MQQVIERCTKLASLAITRAHTEEKIRRQALEDPLTGLPNRALLRNRFEQALEHAGRSGVLVGLVLFDLDRFKDINDTLGHEVGDRVLRHVAAQIESSIPPSDTLARLGGDEFALLMPDLRDVDDAERIARTCPGRAPGAVAVRRHRAEADCERRHRRLPDARIGPERPVPPSRCGDVSRQAARRPCRRLRSGAGSGSTGVSDLCRRIAAAIGAGELALLYQPKISLITGDAVGVECLVRWRHPRRGIIPPSQFIPLAESTGLIKPLTLWVIRQALQDAGRWHERGLDMPVAVNLSAALLHDPELPHVINRELRRSGTSSGQAGTGNHRERRHAGPRRRDEDDQPAAQLWNCLRAG